MLFGLSSSGSGRALWLVSLWISHVCCQWCCFHTCQRSAKPSGNNSRHHSLASVPCYKGRLAPWFVPLELATALALWVRCEKVHKPQFIHVQTHKPEQHSVCWCWVIQWGCNSLSMFQYSGGHCSRVNTHIHTLKMNSLDCVSIPQPSNSKFLLGHLSP